MIPTLYLMMGLPGAGKTTAAKVIEQLTGAVRLSSDEQRLQKWPVPDFSEKEHQELYEYLDQKTQAYLKKGQSVIYDANLNRYIHRQEKYNIAKKLSARTVLCLVQTPKDLAKQRRVGESEHHHLVPKHEDPASMFERIAEIIELPSAEEGYIVLDGTKITPEYVAENLHLNEAH